MEDLVNISFGTAGIAAVLGMLVVVLGLVLLMVVVMIMSKIMISQEKKAEKKAAASKAEKAPEKAKAAEASGTAGELKLYDTDPRDAAMVMAIVADKLGKPLNELRFKSIKEVKDDEI